MNAAALRPASGNVVNLRGGPDTSSPETNGFRPLDLKPLSPPEALARPAAIEASGAVLQTNAPLERDNGDLMAARRRSRYRRATRCPPRARPGAAF